MSATNEIKRLKELSTSLFSSPLAEVNEKLQEKLLVLSNPGVDTSNFRLVDLVDVGLLQSLQDSFSHTYNIASVIYDEHGVPITKPSNFSKFCMLLRSSKLGLHRCELSKIRHYEMTIECGGACLDVCQNFGELLDGSVPLEIEGRRIGTWCAGQRVVEPLHEDRIRKYAIEVGVNPDELWEYSKLLPTGTKEDYKKIIDFLDTMCKAMSLLGLQNVKQAREIYKRRINEAKYKTIFDSS